MIREKIYNALTNEVQWLEFQKRKVIRYTVSLSCILSVMSIPFPCGKGAQEKKKKKRSFFKSRKEPEYEKTCFLWLPFSFSIIKKQHSLLPIIKATQRWIMLVYFFLSFSLWIHSQGASVLHCIVKVILFFPSVFIPVSLWRRNSPPPFFLPL